MMLTRLYQNLLAKIVGLYGGDGSPFCRYIKAQQPLWRGARCADRGIDF